MSMFMTELAGLIDDAPILAEDGSCYVHSGEEYERVTNVLHKALPPYLAPWAEQVGREAVLKLYARDGSLPDYQAPDTKEEVAKQLKAAGWTTEHEKRAGGLRGAQVHFALEAYIKQGIPPSLEDFEPEARPYAQTLCQWLVDYEPEFECSELMVYNKEHGYAGTIDAIGTMTKRPKGARHPDITGKRLAIDLKTNMNKAVYDQHYAQLAAYDLALHSHGIVLDGTAVVAIGPSPGKGTPYRFAVNYWTREDWIPVINLFRMLVKVRGQNPNSRAKK